MEGNSKVEELIGITFACNQQKKNYGSITLLLYQERVISPSWQEELWRLFDSYLQTMTKETRVLTQHEVDIFDGYCNDHKRCFTYWVNRRCPLSMLNVNCPYCVVFSKTRTCKTSGENKQIRE